MYQYNDGQYVIGEIPVLDLAKKYGTPLYIYDARTITGRLREIKKNLGIYPNTRFLYAVKANYNPAILKLILAEGFGVDTVSVEEVKLALLCGANPKNIMYTESNISDAEMEEVRNLGVLLNIGSLSRLEKWGKKYPGSEVCVRFNPDVGAGSHATNITAGPDVKFGIGHERVSEVLRLAHLYNLKIVGIHEHIGSGWLNYREALLAMDIIFDVARQIPGLKFIDLGGGFGVPYKPEESHLDIESLGREYNSKFRAFNDEYQKLFGGRGSSGDLNASDNPDNSALQLRFEPGRYIVAESGHLLAEVNTLKTTANGHVFAGVNTGMNQLVRVAMYGSYHPITNLSNPCGELKKYEICGNICESSDSFAFDRELPEIREGDILSVDIAGAYGMSMASNYQLRGLPAEVLVNGNHSVLIRERQSFEQLLSPYIK